MVCFDEYVGPGYSIPTSDMAEAVRMIDRTKGILLDPVYTGKAMAGLIGLVRKGGEFKKKLTMYCSFILATLLLFMPIPNQY